VKAVYRQIGFKAGFLAPAVGIFVVFFIYPILQTLHVSLYRWGGLSPDMDWVGLDNFRNLLFHDPIFWKAVSNNLFFLIVFPIITLVLSLFFASVFARRFRGSTLLSSVYFFPALISWVAISILWSFIYHPSIGILNSLLAGIGLEGLARTWLADPAVVLGAVAAPLIWRNVGFYMVMFVAAIRNIPPEYHESALIDGASRWTIFRHITLPLIWEVVSVAVVFMVVNAFLAFDLVWIMTQGGPSRHSEILTTYFYRKAFIEFQMGYATAMAVLLFIGVLTVSLLLRRFMQRETVEY